MSCLLIMINFKTQFYTFRSIIFYIQIVPDFYSIIFMKLIFLSLLISIVLSDATNSLTVIHPIDLAKSQKRPQIKMTDFSYRKSNLDVYRYLILAEPFDACSSLTNQGYDISANGDFFVLADGKNCSHRKKAHMAKQFGAIGIIILNDDASMTNEPFYGYKDSKMVSFLIDQNEGENIKSYMSTFNLNSIYVRVNYEVSIKDKSHLEVWVSALDHNSYQALHLINDTLRDFPQIDNALEWKPRYVFYGCNKNSTNSENNVCKDDVATKLSCACNGQFCSPAETSTTSNIIVVQDIRQKQIFKIYPELYFSYVKGIQQKCLQKYKMDKNIDSCSQKVAKQLGINISPINERVTEAVRQCSNSIYGQLYLDKIVYAKINEYPSITLDHQIIQYNSKTDFQQTLCKKLSLEDQLNCKRVVVSMANNSMPWYLWLFLIIGICVVGFFVLMWYRKRINKELDKELKMQVDTAISHYYTFNETQLK